MIEKIIHRISKRHHPWRKMKFDELAEVYTSMSLRSFGFGVIGIFVPVFLFKNGVDLTGIFFFYTIINFGIHSGSSIFISQYWGKEDVKNIRRILGISLFLTTIAGIVFTIAGFFFPMCRNRIFPLVVRSSFLQLMLPLICQFFPVLP